MLPKTIICDRLRIILRTKNGIIYGEKNKEVEKSEEGKNIFGGRIHSV